MWRYILKRLLMIIPVLVGVTFVVYMILSVADGVSNGVQPPAAYFSRGRKVGKSPLRTCGSKNSLGYYQDRMVREAFGRGFVRVTPVWVIFCLKRRAPR